MERTVLLTPRMLCSVSVSGATWRTVPDLREQTRAWKEVARHSPPSAGRPGPAGAVQEEHLLLSGTPSLLDCTTLHLRVCVCLYVCGLRMCADSTRPFHFAFSCRLACEGWGKRCWSCY